VVTLELFIALSGNSAKVYCFPHYLRRCPAWLRFCVLPYCIFGRTCMCKLRKHWNYYYY